MPPGRRRVGLPEALEDVRQQLGRDPPAGVGDAQLDVRPAPREPHVHAATLGRELDRVREQVPRHLLEAVGVTQDDARLGVEGGLQAHRARLGRR